MTKFISRLFAITLIIMVIPMVSIGALDDVPYLDSNGNTQYADGVLEPNSFGFVNYTNDPTWFIVKEDLEFDIAYVFGDIHIILADNATLKVDSLESSYSTSKLTIYAQSTGDNMGSLVATSSNEQVAIGSMQNNSAVITINGGEIIATSNGDSPAIGSGINGNATITINGGKIIATSNGDSPAIGSGNNGNATITINGGKITATSNGDSTAIGSGNNGNAEILISDGEITATSSSNGSTIGSGMNGSADVDIRDGLVLSENSGEGAAIGGGRNSLNSTVTIIGGTIHALSTGPLDIKSSNFMTPGGNAIIHVSNKEDSISGFTDMDRQSCIIFRENVGTIYGNYSLTEDLHIKSDQKLTIADNSELAILQDGQLFIYNGGELINDGHLINFGVITNYKGGTIKNNAHFLQNGILKNGGTLVLDGNTNNIGTIETYKSSTIIGDITLNVGTIRAIDKELIEPALVSSSKNDSDVEEVLVKPIIEGKTTRTIELGKDLVLSSNANYFNYMYTLVNENTKLGRDYLNFDPTTTTITIPAEFIETLGKGEHKVAMVFAQGRAETTFIIE